MKTIALIPARLESKRFPNKLVKKINGIPIILKTYRAALETNLFDEVYVVSGNDEILEIIKNEGGLTFKSLNNHESGTDRIAEAAVDIDHDIVVNLQGDEPFINNAAIRDLINSFKDTDVQIASLMTKFLNLDEILNKKTKEFELNKDALLNLNYNTKNKLVKDIEGLYQTDANSIKDWQEKIKTFESIKKNIEDTGPIPRKLKKSFWNNYKKVVREFYSTKNIFFKKIKKVYTENLSKQNSLINEIINISSKDDLEKERQNVISIQKKWKLIKPVPYKANEKNWKNFKNSCDMFFQKISQNKNLKTKENKEFELKQNKLIEDVEKFSGELVGLEKIFEEYFLNNKLSSEKEKIFFDKIKTQLIKQGLKEEESQNKLNEMKSKFMSYDQKKSEVYKLNLRLDKLKKDLTQQENNLLFFNDKSKENKLLKTVHLKIKNQKLEIEKLIIEKNKLLK